MKPMTERHLAILRRHMVEVIGIHYDLAADEIGRGAIGGRLEDALLKVPRHVFVPSQLAGVAYHDTPLPLGFDKTVSQPFIGALMIDLLEPEAGEQVLEVGTGLGYQSALLAELGARVWTVDVVEEFVAEAGLRLITLGYDNVSLRVGDGSRGWPDAGLFDRILVTAAAKKTPQALIDQLKPGGRIVIPLASEDAQQLSIVDKSRTGEISVREVMPVRFTQLETID